MKYPSHINKLITNINTSKNLIGFSVRKTYEKGILASIISIIIVGGAYTFIADKLVSSEFMQLINMSLMGQNRCMLYTEDTYEVDGYKYFGYLRGKYSKEELKNAQIELLQANKTCFSDNVYIRPIIYLGYGAMGVYHLNSPVEVAIAAWEWGAYLGKEALNKGIRVKISSFVRNSVKSNMGKAKAVANYLNSQMAKHEAIASGFEEALLLDDNGFIAEGSGECFFIIRDQRLITPPYDNSLESITQNTVLTIANDLGIEVEQRRITRDEVYIWPSILKKALEVPISSTYFFSLASSQRTWSKPMSWAFCSAIMAAA